jgi:hypothetical protein
MNLIKNSFGFNDWISNSVVGKLTRILSKTTKEADSEEPLDEGIPSEQERILQTITAEDNPELSEKGVRLDYILGLKSKDRIDGTNQLIQSLTGSSNSPLLTQFVETLDMELVKQGEPPLKLDPFDIEFFPPVVAKNLLEVSTNTDVTTPWQAITLDQMATVAPDPIKKDDGEDEEAFAVTVLGVAVGILFLTLAGMIYHFEKKLRSPEITGSSPFMEGEADKIKYTQKIAAQLDDNFFKDELPELQRRQWEAAGRVGDRPATKQGLGMSATTPEQLLSVDPNAPKKRTGTGDGQGGLDLPPDGSTIGTHSTGGFLGGGFGPTAESGVDPQMQMQMMQQQMAQMQQQMQQMQMKGGMMGPGGPGMGPGGMMKGMPPEMMMMKGKAMEKGMWGKGMEKGGKGMEKGGNDGPQGSQPLASQARRPSGAGEEEDKKKSNSRRPSGASMGVKEQGADDRRDILDDMLM